MATIEFPIKECGEYLRAAELQCNCPECKNALIPEKALVNTWKSQNGQELGKLVTQDGRIFHAACASANPVVAKVEEKVEELPPVPAEVNEDPKLAELDIKTLPLPTADQLNVLTPGEAAADSTGKEQVGAETEKRETPVASGTARAPDKKAEAKAPATATKVAESQQGVFGQVALFVTVAVLIASIAVKVLF